MSTERNEVVVVTFSFATEEEAHDFARAVPGHPSYLCLERKRVVAGESEPIRVVHQGSGS